MAKLQRQSIDQEFRQKYYGQSGSGVQNAQLEIMTSDVRTGNPANSNYHPRKIYQNESFNQYSSPNEPSNDNSAPTSNRNARVAERYYDDSQASQKPKVTVDPVIKTTAKLWQVITNSWTMLAYFIQFWAGLISSLFFGLTAAVTYSYIGEAVTAVAMWAGYTEPNLISLGFWGLITAGAIGLLSLFAAGFHAKMWGLDPLHGHGSGWKNLALIIAITGYCLPLLNMIPWIMLWAWTVKIYPK